MSCASTGGNAGNPATGLVIEEGWGQNQGYSNVTISAPLNDLGGSFPNFTAYLTKAIGAGTTAAQEIAHATIAAPNVSTATTTFQTIFSGLTLPPGNYYLTIYGDPAEPVLGPQCWTSSAGAAVLTGDTGIRYLGAQQIKGVAAYPPASSGTLVGNAPAYLQVTGTVITPPAITKTFGASSSQLVLLPNGSTSLTFTITNPNASISLTGIAFTDTLPGGLLVSNPNGLTGSCGSGTITAAPGANSISLTGATLAGGASCAFSVNVTAPGAEVGSLTNTTSTVTSNQTAPGAAASASIFVGEPFQISYAANLSAGDSYVDATNSGASASTGTGSGSTATIPGSFCLNVYVFAPDEQPVECCSCPITPNGLASLSAQHDLITNPLTRATPTSVVIKLLATVPVGGTCNGSAAALSTEILSAGLAAWNTTLHGGALTETRFVPSTLSAGELQRLNGTCAYIAAYGSGFGICNSCRIGGLGATPSAQ